MCLLFAETDFDLKCTLPTVIIMTVAFCQTGRLFVALNDGLPGSGEAVF